jgi:spermidine/putrescine transport system ATP-binding protein
MGEVNVLDVALDGQGALVDNLTGERYRSPIVPAGFRQGSLVVRPEDIRFLDPGEAADVRLGGTVQNEYLLGSRVQYQVRSGTRTFLVEKLRDASPEGALDRAVTIGWDAKDSMIFSAGAPQ